MWFRDPDPRVARASQPWALRQNPFGIRITALNSCCPLLALELSLIHAIGKRERDRPGRCHRRPADGTGRVELEPMLEWPSPSIGPTGRRPVCARRARSPYSTTWIPLRAGFCGPERGCVVPDQPQEAPKFQRD